MADADVDGEHIATLLLTFLYRHLKEVLEKGYVYIAQPPLYKITTLGSKEEIWALDDNELSVITKNFEEKNTKITGIQRYKGLGEMNSEQLWQTTMNPESRVLKQINIDDFEEADKTFEMLMGTEVPPRKKFIQLNAKKAEIDI